MQQAQKANEELKAQIKELISIRAQIQDSAKRAELFHQIDEAVKVLKANGGSL